MPDTTGFTKNGNKELNSNFSSRFRYFENMSDLMQNKNLNQIELCILKMNFDKKNLETIKKAIDENKQTEFWISSNDTSRKNILEANKIGVKNVVSDPFENKIVEKFFNQQNLDYLQTQSSPTTNYSSLAGLKVMIVDDNSMNIELLEEVLSGLDLNITCFLKPQMAYEQILHEKYDLFLLDVMMPEMSGFDLAKKIQETPHHKSTPVIFISALSDAQNKITGYNLGSHAYIEKPFDVNIIKSQIYNLLKNQKIQEALNSTKEIFLATVAHDLKTPISAEINALSMLLDKNFGELESSQKEILEDILNSTKFMQNMVENLLCKNKFEYGKIELSRQVYALDEVVKHCIDITKYILIDKKQKAIFNCKAKNTLIPVDFMEINRAIHNLIANASAYSPNGTEIIIELENLDDDIVLSVQDFGKGIAIEHQKDVFSQYMSFAKEHKTVGSGLGLFITKNIVEAHGGEILLESKVGYGTKIRIILPMYTKV